jgi:hypothetical protein
VNALAAYDTDTVCAAPLDSVIAPPSVGGTTVPPEIVLPLPSTFHTAAASVAAPFALASGLTSALIVHVPAANDMPPAGSTTQPVQLDGIGGGPGE